MARRAERLSRAGLLAAIVLPALGAGGGVLAVARDDGGPGGDPAKLASQAERPRTIGARATRKLRPVFANPGAASVSLDRYEGGARPAPPRRISIPAAGVETVIVPVGTRRGEIEVPKLGRAGWYEGGPRPGEKGRAVVIGHLDTRSGPGLFARVPEVPMGTRVRITDRRGVVHRYEVTGRARVRKDRFPTSEVYGGASRPVLVLVTCGGPYSEDEGYRDNVLLYARGT